MTEYLKREDVRRAVLHNEGDAVIAAIDELPKIDDVPVVHGYWIKVAEHVYRCSLCNNHRHYKSRYCPNCGAKMDGERKDGVRDEQTD